MPYGVFLFFGFFILPTCSAQEWITNSKPMVITQEDKTTQLAFISVPEKTSVEKGANYAKLKEGKNHLNISYILDDTQATSINSTARDKYADLVKYSTGIQDSILSGNPGETITDKITDSQIRIINGFETIRITYQYKREKNGLQNSGTGKAIVYLIKTNGYSHLNPVAHTIIILLKFEFPGKNRESLENLSSEIVNTINKGS